MRSGDELDRLMASAVVDGHARAPRGRVASPRAIAAPASATSGPAADSPASRTASRTASGTERKLAEIEAKVPDVGRAENAPPPPQEPPRAPLGRSEITEVMKSVQDNMNDCYRRHGQGGPAEVRVEVTPQGSVAGTIVRGELANTPTAGCVESKLKAAVFPVSSGITFTYRLVVK
jgi:hypothetical protein